MRKLLTAEQLTTWFGRLRLLSLLLALRSKALCIDSIMAQESSVAQGSTMEQLAEWCHFLRVEGSSNIKLLNAFGWVQSIN